MLACSPGYNWGLALYLLEFFIQFPKCVLSLVNLTVYFPLLHLSPFITPSQRKEILPFLAWWHLDSGQPLPRGGNLTWPSGSTQWSQNRELSQWLRAFPSGLTVSLLVFQLRRKYGYDNTSCFWRMYSYKTPQIFFSYKTLPDAFLVLRIMGMLNFIPSVLCECCPLLCLPSPGCIAFRGW